MQVNMEPIIDPTAKLIELDPAAFNMKVVLLSRKQHGHTGWLDAKMKSGYLEEPGIGCFIKKELLLETWQDFHRVLCLLLKEGLKRNEAGKQVMSDEVRQVLERIAEQDAFDLSDSRLNQIRGSIIIQQVKVKGTIWRSPGCMRSVAWWPKDREGLVKVLALEIEEKKREEEEEARRLVKMQQPVDPEVKARVLDWLLRLLPGDPAEARFWVTETSTPFARPDLDQTTTAEAEHGAARGQGGPLNESTASNIASSGASIRAVDARSVKEEVFTPPGAADCDIVSNSRTQSAKRKRGE